MLSGDRGAVTNLYLATKEINNLGDDFAPFAERINEYYYGVRDQADSIIDKLDALLESNDNIEEIDNRLYLIRKLIRKYGTSAVDVLAAKKIWSKSYLMLKTLKAKVVSVKQSQMN